MGKTLLKINLDARLVYNIRQGWYPLAEFLGWPVPDEPIPFLNNADSMARLGLLLGFTMVAWPMLLSLWLMLMATVAYYFFSSLLAK